MTEARGPVRPEAVARILDRVVAEEQAGRLWRAREILRGALRTHHGNPVILERYGRLLDKLGDRLEAGKYLFLSGAEGPDVDEAVTLFLERHGRGDRGSLLCQFPRRIRLMPLSEFPPRVTEHLQRLGVDPPHEPWGVTLDRAIAPPSRLGDGLRFFGCAVVGLVVLACCLVGAVTIVGWFGKL